MPETSAVGAATFELDRFEWVRPDRIELLGIWSGVRARRFIRPTLVLSGEGESKRLLASLEHKPWAADDGEEWIAAFVWDGEPTKFESAELNVAPGIDLSLSPPRMRPGKPRRFRPKIESFDGSRTEPLVRGPGIVSEPHTEAAPSSPEAAPSSPEAAPSSPEAAPSSPVAAAKELRAIRDERDEALTKLRALRSELEEVRQSRETAIAEARAQERGSATTMLSEGAELRAGVERQREIAHLERDDAFRTRDEAIRARDRASEERDEARRLQREAERARDAALADRDRAHKDRDRANKERDRAIDARDNAVQQRDEARERREHAIRERDEIVNLHERGLPVKQPEPRFLPQDRAPRSELEIWGPRAGAIGMLVLFGFLFLRLVVGL